MLVHNSEYIFRYIGENEFQFIRENGFIYSYNLLGTHWTTLLTGNADKATDYLALESRPKHRVGGFPLSDASILRLVVRRGKVVPLETQNTPPLFSKRIEDNGAPKTRHPPSWDVSVVSFMAGTTPPSGIDAARAKRDAASTPKTVLTQKKKPQVHPT
jgi:hypothetical protein